MRREGRVHGSFVRMSKHDDSEYNKGSPRKPTNHSRVTSSCPGNTVRCVICNDKPVLKAMCKTKGKYKLKDHDITKNYKLHEFRLGCQTSSRFVSSSAGFSEYYRDSAEDLGYNYYSEYDGYDDQEETLDKSDDHRGTEMMFTIASFLRDMRGHAHQVTVNVGTPDSISEEEKPNETSQHWISNEPDLQIDTATDSDCSWSGVDTSDSEQTGVDVDGWYLVG